MDRQRCLQTRTERYGRNSLDPVVHLYIDMEHEAVTIYEDNLRSESPSRRALDIQNIYTALCLRAGIAPTRMQWIGMDVDDRATAIMLREHRVDNELGLDDFYITPGQAGWEAFSNNRYFQAAAKVIPQVEIDRIAVRRQQRGIQVPGYPPVDVQSITFSFKQPDSEDHDASIDRIDENLLEIKINNNLDSIVKSAQHAILVSSTTL
ncbi:hypothetical protein Cpir12675_006325 [Ceratocystis pirilliformis]|uniref:Uncharacterized protein n=1 Tax=Ceratocystis pirilliformis TaxID=259994 RepID=A0ABR3YI97_9PEZI